MHLLTEQAEKNAKQTCVICGLVDTWLEEAPLIGCFSSELLQKTGVKTLAALDENLLFTKATTISK